MGRIRPEPQPLANADRFASLTAIRQAIRAAANIAPAVDRRTRNREYVRQLERILEVSPHIPVTLGALAELLDLERTYCSKAFREIAGESFSSWIRRIRVTHAMKLLRGGTHSITHIAHAVGYADITTLERNFRKETGVCPAAFQGNCPAPAGAEKAHRATARPLGTICAST